MSDRLARYGWRVVVVAVGLAIVGGVFYAATWKPGPVPAPVEECANPPCFGGGGLPSLRDLPVVVPMMGYGLAILLGMASGIAGVRSRQGPRRAIRSLLPFIGPLLILIGTEIVPHVLRGRADRRRVRPSTSRRDGPVFMPGATHQPTTWWRYLSSCARSIPKWEMPSGQRLKG